MLDRSDVVAAYRMILGREPESEDVIERHASGHTSLTTFRLSLFASGEFAGASFHDHALAFQTAYDRPPTSGELEALIRYSISVQVSNSTENLRAAVAAFSRYEYPTPVTVRFTEKSLDTIEIPQSGQRLVLDRYDRSVARTIIDTRDYERHLSRFIEAVVKPGMVCVDIGANVGFHTFFMRHMIGGKGFVYAIEPNSENCRMLLLSIQENGADNVLVLPVALSNRLGSVPFSPAVGSNGGFMYTTNDPLYHPNCTVVPTLRLDDLISPDRLDFIKIDVEGAEPLALAGAEALIRQHRPIITSEFSDAMIRGVSGISGEDYLGRMMRDGYRAYTLGFSGPFEEITDVSKFMAAWPDQFRIEDLAFVPVEADFNFAEYSMQHA